ncbi:MAG: hypothetical protein AAB557_00005, partial [Patescibacteria group bacterium]
VGGGVHNSIYQHEMALKHYIFKKLIIVQKESGSTALVPSHHLVQVILCVVMKECKMVNH